MNKILSVGFALFLVACAGEAPSESGTPTGPQPGEACSNEGDYGGRCRDSVCPNGDPLPAPMLCNRGRWTCVYDALNLCRSVACPTPTAEQLSACRQNSSPCPGGRIPFDLFCDRNGWQCRADRDRCIPDETDAGPPADAQVSTDATDADIEPRLACSLSYDGPASHGFAPGVRGARMLQFRLQCSEEVELRELPVTLEASATDVRIVSTNRQLVASDVRLVHLETGASILGPLPIRPDDVSSTLGAVTGMLQGGGMRLEANHEYAFAIVVSLPERVDPELFGRRFRVRIGENGRFFTNRSLYRVERGTFYTVSSNSGLEPQVEGNLMWIEQPRVSVNIHPTLPSLQTVTRNARAIQAMTVSFNNLSSAVVRLGRVTYTVAADLGYGYRTQMAHRVLLWCTHACAGTGASGPYGFTTEGRIGFPSSIPPIAARGAAHCTLTCGTDSVVEGPHGDRFAAGIANPADVSFEDEFGNAVIVEVDERLQRQLSAPTHTTTIVSSGYLTINNFSVPNREVTGPVSEWLRIGTYALNVSYEDALLSSVGVRIDGASRCVNEVRVQTSTSAPATAFVPFDVSHVDVFWPSPVALGLGNTTLDIYVRVNPAVAPMVNPNGCHPGDSVTVSIDYGDTSPEWGSFFGSAANLRVLGTNSGLLMQYGGRPGPGGSLLFR